MAYSKGITRGFPAFYPIFLLLCAGERLARCASYPTNINRKEGKGGAERPLFVINLSLEPREASLRSMTPVYPWCRPVTAWWVGRVYPGGVYWEVYPGGIYPAMYPGGIYPAMYPGGYPS